VNISLWSTGQVGAEKIQNARELIERRTGENANIDVREVASRSELTGILARISVPVEPPAPKPQTLTEISSDVLSRLKPALDDVWPTKIPLVSYGLGFASDGPTVSLDYQAQRPLDNVSAEMLQQSLAASLGLPALKVELKREPLPRHTTRRSGK